ncbi:cupin [Rhodococcus sp. 14-2496-1d]|uniref:(R)-mandelonitrile lyase n=1 Tax=Rhodococcus sp. 14-2496-1d TaxID=2023146 RepID=UPI000B9AAEB1|nr:cupin domain-containing protein [Rhodococcus sp. 14-2496-1d]OZF25701.1 cupin [Rhodococcus sp. 14-2496-1d]
MDVIPSPETTRGPSEKFTGDVWIDVLTRGEGDMPLRVSVVRFTPGSRNAWHNHIHGQTLYVTEGIGLVQSRGGEVVEIRAGDTVYTPPGEWHWHGAAPGHAMTHIAMFQGAPEGGSDAQWGEHVTEEEYCACAATTPAE